MDQLSRVARVTFVVHVIAAVLVGLPLLLAPLAFGGLFGYPVDALALQPVLRAFGAILLAFGGLTSFYGARAQTWQQVDYIVRGEVAYLGLQTLVFLLSALTGVGPALGNWLFALVSAGLLVLFVLTFVSRQKAP